MTDNRMNDHESLESPGSPGVDRSLLVDLAHGRIPPDESGRLLDIIAADEELSKELEIVILLVNEGARRRGGQKVAYPRGNPTSGRIREARSLSLTFLRVAAMILVFLGAGWFADDASSPRFANLAQVSPADLHVRMRAGDAGIVNGSRLFLYEGDWQECVRRVDWYLAVYPGGEELATASMLKGAAYLMGARSQILGFHVRYDAVLVDSAMSAFQLARSRVTSSEMRDDIDWFEAKAMLMKGDPAAAGIRLRRIIGGTGARMDDARKLLEQLPVVQR
jgi:hypothetical protein